MAWNKLSPRNQDQGLDSAPQFRENFSEIENAFATDHNIPDDSAEGEHKKVTLTRPLGASEVPLDVADKGFVYTKNVSSTQTGDEDEVIQAELFFKDEDANEVQVTEGGRISPRTIYMKYNQSTGVSEFHPQTEPKTYSIKRLSSKSFIITIPEQAKNFFTYEFNIIDSANASGFARIVHETKKPVGSDVEDDVNTYIHLSTYTIPALAAMPEFILQIKHAV